MATSHKLTARDTWFLSKGLCDPVMKAPFAEGDTVVFCANCKSPHDISTWGLDPGRRCAACQKNDLLEFDRFSPEILRPKIVRKTGFRVVGEKLSVREKLEQFNGYPWAYAAVVLLPLLAAVLLFVSAYMQGVRLPSTAEAVGTAALVRLEEMLEDMDGNVSAIGDRIVQEKVPDRQKRMAEGARQAGAKVRRAPSRLLLALSGLKGIPAKLEPVARELRDAVDGLGVKLESVFSRIVDAARRKIS